jgi:hypothetical protein
MLGFLLGLAVGLVVGWNFFPQPASVSAWLVKIGVKKP